MYPFGPMFIPMPMPQGQQTAGKDYNDMAYKFFKEFVREHKESKKKKEEEDKKKKDDKPKPRVFSIFETFLLTCFASLAVGPLGLVGVITVGNALKLFLNSTLK